jgi:hypothetical protein
MKKKALSALVLGSLCVQASDMIRQPVEAFEQMGSKQRFGDPIDPDTLIDPRNHPPAHAPRPDASQAPEEPVPTDTNRSSDTTTEETPRAAPQKESGATPDPFGGRHIPLTCGARCGIPLEDYNDSSKG